MTEIKAVKLNELVMLVESAVEGFNDCACCPLMYDCEREYIDVTDCTEDLIKNMSI